MGSGKSSVGEELAKKLGITKVDTDELIVEKHKMSINEIFSKYGEKYFRDLETRVLKEVLTQTGYVVSTGGGIVLKEENWDILKRSDNAVTVSLMAEAKTLYERVKEDNSRPLLQADDPYEKICELLKRRENLYLRAEIIIWTDNLRTREVADHIIDEAF